MNSDQTEVSSLLIREIGEQGLLERLQRFCPREIVGDDAAVVPSPEWGQALVVTTDVLVDGVHFSDRTTSPQDVGWRAAAVNLSDLAAMGASPLGITVGLSVTGETQVSWVEQLYQGISLCLNQYNTPIVGGDVCRSPVITVSITAFGQVFPNRVLRRSAAKVGDAIVVTGVHGASRAGLELLLHPELGEHLSEQERSHFIQAHQRPQPRLDIIPLIWKILDAQSLRSLVSPDQGESSPPLVLPDQGECLPPLAPPDQRESSPPLTPPYQGGEPELIHIAGMDSSDGLADAVVQICRASGVGAAIARSQIPLPSALSKLVSGEQALNWALYGGEDFELLLCLPPEPAEALVEQLGGGAAIIGEITMGKDVWLRDSSRNYEDELLTLNRGFQHF